jgi:Leucine-rich repeat (LRR) protein
VLASTGLWGDLAVKQAQLAPPQQRASLAAWLSRRRAACRRLRLSLGAAGAEALGLLGCPEGGCLRALELSSHQLVEDGEAGFQALRHMGSLTRLELRGGLLATLPSHLSCLRALAMLDLSRNRHLGEAPPELTLWPLQHLLGLTALDLSSCGIKRLPAYLSSLRGLAALDLNTAGVGGEGAEAALQPLRHLMALTSLNLRWCGLTALPSHLSALTNLAVLDASRNMQLGSGGEAATQPLQQLTAVTALDLSYCGLEALPPQLPALRRLAALGLSGNLKLGEGGEAAWQPLRQLRALTRLDLTRCNVPQRLFDLLVAMSTAGVCVNF